ncbi:MAG TPA: cation:proton antiporter [Actinophytocola sp.]|nr:cation:proton antiporter [Actinophytocola sp.]
MSVRNRIGRTAAIYTALVVVPAAVAVVALVSADLGSDDVHPGGSAAASVVQHPMARLFLAIATIVGVCKLAGVLMRKIGQPPVIGEIAAGMVLGPSVLGALWPAGSDFLLPQSVLPQINILAQLGVVLFVFLTGLELDLGKLKGRGPLALVVSHVSIATPFMLGVLLAIPAYDRFAPDGVGFLPFAMFFGVSLSITALPVLARILVDLGLYRTRIGTLVMTCALAGDVTAWILLALVIAVVGVSSIAGVVTTAALTTVFAVLLFALRPWLTRLLETPGAHRLRMIVQVVIVGVLLCATATEWIGVHAIFGAFLLGLVLPGESIVGEKLFSTINSLTSTLLLPLFFAYSGLRTELTLLRDGSMWAWCGVVLVLAMLGKLVGAMVAARAMGADWNHSMQIGALMNSRGLTELVVLNIGLDLGVLTKDLFAILVLMTLVTTALASPIVTGLRKSSWGRLPASESVIELADPDDPPPGEPAEAAEASVSTGAGRTDGPAG